MSKESTKILGTIESQGLMIRSLKESICREILELKSVIRGESQQASLADARQYLIDFERLDRDF